MINNMYMFLGSNAVTMHFNNILLELTLAIDNDKA